MFRGRWGTPREVAAKSCGTRASARGWNSFAATVAACNSCWPAATTFPICTAAAGARHAAGGQVYSDVPKKGKCVVLKTSTRQTVFLPVAGLVDPATLKPGDLVGVNKDSYLILDTLPAEYDSR